ncbi:unnamed protein product [Closterium sp. NIES-54]
MNIDPGAVAPFLAFYQFYGPESLCLAYVLLLPTQNTTLEREAFNTLVRNRSASLSLLGPSLESSTSKQRLRSGGWTSSTSYSCSPAPNDSPLISLLPVSVLSPRPAGLQGSVYNLVRRQAGLHGHARLLPRNNLRFTRDRPASRLRALRPQAAPAHCLPAHPPARPAQPAPGRCRYSRERATVPQQDTVRGDCDAEDREPAVLPGCEFLQAAHQEVV